MLNTLIEEESDEHEDEEETEELVPEDILKGEKKKNGLFGRAHTLIHSYIHTHYIEFSNLCAKCTELEEHVTELNSAKERMRLDSLYVLDRSVTTIKAIEEMNSAEMIELGDSIFELQLDRDELKEALRVATDAHTKEIVAMSATIDTYVQKIHHLEGTQVISNETQM